MKKLSLLCALLLLVGASASAHDGAISLYADTGLNSCSMEIIPGGTGTAHRQSRIRLSHLDRRPVGIDKETIVVGQ